MCHPTYDMKIRTRIGQNVKKGIDGTKGSCMHSTCVCVCVYVCVCVCVSVCRYMGPPFRVSYGTRFVPNKTMSFSMERSRRTDMCMYVSICVCVCVCVWVCE